MENQTSMLPQPAARPTGGVMRALSEVSEFENNARSAMPPPSASAMGLKRQGSNLPEPAQKRKTPAERSGDTTRPSSTSARPASAASQNASSATTLYRSSSNASSLSRSTSVTSRNVLASSYTGSLGSGIRPPSSMNTASNTVRPKSSYARERGFSKADTRPNTSLANLAASHEMHVIKKNFDPDEQYKDFKRMFEDYKQMHHDSMEKIDSARQENNVYKESLTKLEQEKSSQMESIIQLKSENQTLTFRVETAENTVQELKKDQDAQLEELKRDHRTNLESLRQEQRKEIEDLRAEHWEELRELKERHQGELERERAQKFEAMSQVSTQGALEKQRHQIDLDRKGQEIASVRLEVERVQSALEREKQLNDDLRKSLKIAGEDATSMETTRQGLQAKVAYLESDSKSQSEAYADMEKRMNEALQKAQDCEGKLRKEETMRRKLHNQVQELKGNIRVFCRVRPTLSADEELAKMKYPDSEESTEIEVRGADEVSSLGKDVTKTHPFSFDRVFDPKQTNDNIFHEISQLIQSALDGYNVCIFAYGQTGSGKTYTMSSEDGMIPRALRQIYSTSKELKDRGWTYRMEGSFVEVYNEEIRDLLADDDKGTKKHEVHHDMLNHETTITNVTTLSLDNQDQVESILSQAMLRRSIAATKANEHSSRSHSVFILKLVGENRMTGEKSKGTLNLVDLAGSERMRNADTSGQRLKETQSINKSLSCLGDVIGALGQQGQTLPLPSDARSSLTNTRETSSSVGPTAHIPYRNSKLTYLLQFSLGGNSKTLMFVMVAPEKKCLGETITSLKFAEKVSRTRVGVAKRVK